jgi:hypothetical protein
MVCLTRMAIAPKPIYRSISLIDTKKGAKVAIAMGEVRENVRCSGLVINFAFCNGKNKNLTQIHRIWRKSGIIYKFHLIIVVTI